MSDKSKFSNEIQEWAYINFSLQTFLYKDNLPSYEVVQSTLDKIGYKGRYRDILDDVKKKEMIMQNAFFGSLQTGNRIVAFALSKSGLNRDMLRLIHESIECAYETVVQENGANELSEASYRHTMQTLSVFTP